MSMLLTIRLFAGCQSEHGPAESTAASQPTNTEAVSVESITKTTPMEISTDSETGLPIIPDINTFSGTDTSKEL